MTYRKVVKANLLDHIPTNGDDYDSIYKYFAENYNEYFDVIDKGNAMKATASSEDGIIVVDDGNVISGGA